MSGTGGIVLAGGASSRMGRPKADLPWDGVPLAARVAGVVAAATDVVVVVGAAGQRLPPLPPGVETARDARPGRGPLEGMVAGLEALGGRAGRVFVTGVDAPHLHPLLVARVLALLGPGHDAAVPVTGGGRPQPLAAAYRAGVADEARALLDAGRLRMGGLLDRLAVRWLDAATLLADPALAAADPHLAGLEDVDTPAQYAAARGRGRGVVSVPAHGSVPGSRGRVD
ncbi:molybdenum cofactor guanylyltransferase [Miltoncostaea marina]|uniref:molybdenum cofactor guanylyltransferase n=1 Tax=Miltoncostaea marina TaxID=2843215 RepID=UPI001C3E6B0F|nr:molybdenum cofactor guanylyltransferase [Miltoncostaea marina]